MSDKDTGSKPTSTAAKKSTGNVKAEADKTKAEAKSTAKAASQEAKKTAGAAADETKGVTAEASAKAREVADEATRRLRETVEDTKFAGAERAERIARAVERAADELEDELPLVARYIRRGASEIEDAAVTAKERDARDLVTMVRGFARRQPAAFVGLTGLAGFAVARFLAASAPDAHSYQSDYGSNGDRLPVPLDQTPSSASPLPATGDPGGVSPSAPGFGDKSAGTDTAAG